MGIRDWWNYPMNSLIFTNWLFVCCNACHHAHAHNCENQKWVKHSHFLTVHCTAGLFSNNHELFWKWIFFFQITFCMKNDNTFLFCIRTRNGTTQWYILVSVYCLIFRLGKIQNRKILSPKIQQHKPLQKFGSLFESQNT